MSGEALKPCPFCGAAGVAWRGPEKGNACCPSDELPCGAVFYDAADWNRRPGESALEAEITRLRVERDAAVARSAAADDLLSDGMGVILSLSGGYDVWSEQVRDHLDRCLTPRENGEADR